MKVLLFQANSQADQSRRPPYPDGFPVMILTYDQFAPEPNWHPRDVDRLTRSELFWFPVWWAAKREAAAKLAKDD